MKKEKFARYPSCFGKLDCRGLVRVAHKYGMEVISARKPDMHCFNEIGLFGTRDQMKKVECEWTEKGNTPKPKSFKSVFGVNLDIPREAWASVRLAKAKKLAIPTAGGNPLGGRMNPMADENQPGYMPTVDVIRIVRELRNRDYIRRLAKRQGYEDLRQLPQHLDYYELVNAVAIETMCREILDANRWLLPVS